MSHTTIHIPTLETERLILRAPSRQDIQFYVAFKTSQRSAFTDGPHDPATATALFSEVAGQWIMRGYGLFMATTKADPDTVVGGFGVFHPEGQEEPEFGWSLYAAEHEGKGYVTEAMRGVIPWAWTVLGVNTAQSHVHAGNDASVIVAERLGAAFDPEQTRIASAEGGQFYDPARPIDKPKVHIWRHTKGQLK
ncbi:GNAT family N-acetyltransferase [uncultured Sulfitobacter sp.]|uniref:GNAT family N-acetyltransferase n=1 Tax=uncultured Sulfitobacter sp. TaxID=191468 RepID=UPI00260263FC|nr:GNAT family N-acetyltransferase [uncultured Sulfitobacter sp.]